MHGRARTRRLLGAAVAALVAGQLAVLSAWSPGGVRADLATDRSPTVRPPLTAPLLLPGAGAGDEVAAPTTAPAPPTTGVRAPTTAPPTTPVTTTPTTAPASTAPLATVPPPPVPPVAGPSGDPLPLGSVTATSPTTAGCPAGARCWEATVRCPALPDAAAVVAVESPARAATGVVVMFSGGRGETWWEDGHVPGSGVGAPAVADLVRAGLEAVQVRWPDGFSGASSGTGPGFGRLACRSATAVAWVRSWRYDALGVADPAGPCGFCVTGNSGGASQAAWGLTHYGLAGAVDGLVLTSGPPHASIDKGCLRRPGESAYWYDDGTASGFDRAYGATRGGAGPCTRHDPSAAGAWQADGVATGGSSYAWPGTDVTFLFGDRDPTVGPTHGGDLAARLRLAGTPVATDVVDGMGHEVVASPAGRAALVRVLTERA